MHHFHYVDGALYCESVSVTDIAEDVGTPVFIYSRETLERHFSKFTEPLVGSDHLTCYSVKACSNLAILRLFAGMGSGMDIVSGGELFRALKAGVAPSKIVYSGVGKSAAEIDQALQAGILMFNVESAQELEALDARAQAMGIKARMALRVNPDVDPKTHPYISTGLKKNKFGVEAEKALELYRRAKSLKGIDPVGVDCHIGSQLTDLSPFLEALDKVADLIKALRAEGVDVRYLDVGGGLGISYDDEEPPTPLQYGSAVIQKAKEIGVTLILEPGRVLVGNAGIAVTRVLYTKTAATKNFVIVDAAMNDLMRPTLYDAHHGVWRVSRDTTEAAPRTIVADVVGPICESGDFLARDRVMESVQAPELLAIMSAGAYGFSMSSNYNSRPRAAEVLVSGKDYYVIRSRETYEDLVNGEAFPPFLAQ